MSWITRGGGAPNQAGFAPGRSSTRVPVISSSFAPTGAISTRIVLTCTGGVFVSSVMGRFGPP
jgi:hypothetical protein